MKGYKMDFNGLEDQLDIASRQLRNGISIWNKIKIELRIPNSSCVLLFPSADRDVNTIFLRYISWLVERKKYEGAYVLAADEWVTKNAPLFSGSVSGTMQLSEYESDCLVKYYALIEFSNRFYVCSITEPEGRLGELLIENSIPLEEIVCAGVYRLYGNERSNR